MSRHSMFRTKPVEDVLAQAGGPDGEGEPVPVSAVGQRGEDRPQHERLVRRLGPVDTSGWCAGSARST